MKRDNIVIMDGLKRMIIKEHPYAVSKGADGRERLIITTALTVQQMSQRKSLLKELFHRQFQ